MGALFFSTKKIMHSFIIDAHEDLAYSALTFGRDYRRAAAETRQREAGTQAPVLNGEALLGWPDYQRGQVALVVGSIFTIPARYATGDFETQVFADPRQARVLMRAQVDFYQRLCAENPHQFRLVTNQPDLLDCLAPWRKLCPAAGYAEETRPVGVLMALEGAEGLDSPEAMEEWWQAGVRMAGPVWAGTRFCGGTFEGSGFTREGLRLLEVMAGLGMGLDLAHMRTRPMLEALDRYEGPLAVSHANVRALVREDPNERQLSEETIRGVVERDGVIGVLGYNLFLKPGWRRGDPKQQVGLEWMAAHIDAVCQVAGDARHVGLGSDFDGGFGRQEAPDGVESIADLQKLAALLAERGYNEDEIGAVLGGNWARFVERILPSE
ncbi:hypothetical protein ADN00_14595 [Ornatilinea apprima]|uniref:Peptidase M19 n=2 Tax=Ornatilinea apprima TaxID=1134406 RepID=A0A0P6X244_9CHLR|nr:hypothetical protein ADN00_14595 [Ornatilinea apprima]